MRVKREDWIDAVKGFAIYLVILGHSIQYATPRDYNYWGNSLFRIIYSFHMPLFMLMSGYLFYYSMTKYSIGRGIVTKLKGILVPCMAWGLITYLIDRLVTDYDVIGVGEYLDYAFGSNWFLWTVLQTSLLVYIFHGIFKRSYITFPVLLILNYLLPDQIEKYHIHSVRRLLLFFIVGILLNKYKCLNRMNKKQYLCVFTLNVVVYITLMFFVFRQGGYFGEQTCLLTGWEGAKNVILHQLMELSGCGIIILSIYQIQQKFSLTLLRKFGEVSIVIYVLSGIVFWFLVKDYLKISEEYRYLVKAGYVFVISVVMIIVSYFVAVLLKKNRITRNIFLGR